MGGWLEEVWTSVKTAFSEFISASGLSLIIAVLTLVIGVIIIRLAFKSITKRMQKRKTVSTLSTFLISIGKFVSYIILFLIILSILGVNINSLLVVFGSASIAVGLAMQGTLSNFFSGMMILMTKPFKIGNYIDVGDKSGTVKSIGILNTSLITPDNKMIIISNGDVTQNAIVNYSYHKTRRLEIKFYTSLSAGADIVKNAVSEILFSHPDVLKEAETGQTGNENINAEMKIQEEKSGNKKIKSKKVSAKARWEKLHLELSAEFDPYTVEKPVVRLLEFAPSHLTFAARVWVETSKFWSCYFDLSEQIQDALIKNKIEIPSNKIILSQ